MTTTSTTSPSVKGYTPLNETKIALANEGKELEERYMRWLDKLVALNLTVAENTPSSPLPYDGRGIAEARTCIQTGAMWAIRAIFQPTRIALPEDPLP